MKKIYSLLILSVFAVVVACTDDDLDPLNFKKVSKGIELALRGDALDAIYGDGDLYYSSFVPLIADGTETFTYEAEYLSDDPTSLASMDVYAENSDGDRTLLKNIPFSAFTTKEGERPMVSVSFTLKEILDALAIDNSFPDPLDPTVVEELLTDYANGIPIVTDLNLTNGEKVLADDLVAIGLYQSDQFYPAQRLPFGVIEYCPYTDEGWEGNYKALETRKATVARPYGGKGGYGPYTVQIVQTDIATFEIENVFRRPDGVPDGPVLEIVFSESESPDTQVVTLTSTTVDGKTLEGDGTYEQCDHTISLDLKWGDTEFTYTFSFKSEFEVE